MAYILKCIEISLEHVQFKANTNQMNLSKEIVEKRHGEPIKFIFLPKMGLLDSQASTEKKIVMNYELLLRAVFSCLHCQKLILNEKKNTL